MPIAVSWRNEQKTEIVFTFDGHWDLDDFYHATDAGNALLDEVTYTVNMILDVQNSRSLPGGFMHAIKSTPNKVHPNAGIMVMVGMSAFARAFINVYRKVYPKKVTEKTIHFSGTYDEADAIFERLSAVSMHA